MASLQPGVTTTMPHCHFSKSASATAIGMKRLALSHSATILIKVVCSSPHLVKADCNAVHRGSEA